MPRREIVLETRNLSMHFGQASGFLKRPQRVVKAVDNVSLDVFEGETLGLVGESGCGKSTLGRSILQLYKPTAGTVQYRGTDLVQLEGKALRKMRNRFQMIYQDPYASLNPRMKIADIIGEPMYIHQLHPRSEIRAEVEKILEMVGLTREFADRYPHEFSGGQRQRISIARALALNPEIIVLDEPTSALDVSVQAQILNLLNDLQAERNLAYLFVTHDLSVVRHMADRLVVMYLGKVCEAGETQSIFAAPHHPYTRALMAAKPDLDDDRAGENVKGLDGIVPDPARPPQGCRFHTRCEMATPVCGWEVDDVVRWLEDEPGMFEHLSGVERQSEFNAELAFDSEEAAAKLSMAIRSESVPAAMKSALKRLKLDGHKVDIEFEAVDEVQLTARDGGRLASCVLDPDEVAAKSQ